MNRILNILLISILLQLPFSVYSQEINLEKKKITLTDIDTTHCIEIITQNARILIDKTDYLSRFGKNYKNNTGYITTLNNLERPKICLLQNPKLLTKYCTEKIDFDKYGIPELVVRQEIAEILLSGKCTIFLHSNNKKIKNLKVKEKSFKELMGSKYLIFTNSKNEILSVLVGLGE
ncbi:MAG: hypothetical protein Q8P20_05580 [bacterium]|nr:hypothetical protein [bacterium]